MGVEEAAQGKTDAVRHFCPSGGIVGSSHAAAFVAALERGEGGGGEI